MRKISVLKKYVETSCRKKWKRKFAVLRARSEDAEAEGSRSRCPVAVPILMIAFLKFLSLPKAVGWWQRGKSKLCFLLGAWCIIRDKRGWEVAVQVQVQPDVVTPRGCTSEHEAR